MAPACDIKRKRKIQLVVTGGVGMGEGQLVALGGGVEVDTWNTKEASLVLKVIFTYQDFLLFSLSINCNANPRLQNDWRKTQKN